MAVLDNYKHKMPMTKILYSYITVVGTLLFFFLTMVNTSKHQMTQKNSSGKYT